MGKHRRRWRTLAIAACLIAGGHAAEAQEAAPSTSNFHSVGFDINTRDAEAYKQSILSYAETCEVIDIDEDNVICRVENERGGQLWIGLREANDTFQYVTANPAFVGKSAFPVSVIGLQSDDDYSPFEYRLAVRFSEFDIPLLVELADPREAPRFANLEEPLALTLDLTAFTYNPEIFPDKEAFAEAQKKLGEDVAYAPDYFIPSGLFGEDTSSRATFGGEILEAERVNTEDGASHWRTLVRVQGGGTVNVVFDDIWSDSEPKPGYLISGAFWLSAQVPDKAPDPM
ncbi:MAG: hypothetical protein AAFW59_03850 [Pseudomonadota bacterium]